MEGSDRGRPGGLPSPASEGKALHGPSQRCRGLFPLEGHNLITPEAQQLNSKQKGRLIKDIDETRWALNWLHGEGRRAPASSTFNAGSEHKIFILQRQMQQRLEECNYRALRVDSAIAPQEALGSLLKGRSPYGNLSTTTVVPCIVSKVALPECGASRAPLAELLPSQDRHYFHGGAQAMLASVEHRTSVSEALGDASSFMDVRLDRDPKLYAQFVARCVKMGMVSFTLEPLCVQGVFFVKRKDGRQRFILDCRRANRFFIPPPSTSLITGEGLGGLEIDAETNVDGICFFGCADVEACFHRLCVPECITKYFCWEPIEARFLKLTEVNGTAVAPTDLVWPMQLTLAMGFSWATYLAQAASFTLFSSSLPPLVLSDRSEDKVLTFHADRSCHFCYIDNLGIFGSSQPNLQAALDRSISQFADKGLHLHEINLQAGASEALGMIVDTEMMETGNSWKCFWAHTQSD